MMGKGKPWKVGFCRIEQKSRFLGVIILKINSQAFCRGRDIFYSILDFVKSILLIFAGFLWPLMFRVDEGE